ncbi:hypothetical protein GJ496_006260 [Pomphorhynchus laevis]|nr:hypothetical protein GJ496_006260 [Pomphorhynchus laevis]
MDKAAISELMVSLASITIEAIEARYGFLRDRAWGTGWIDRVYYPVSPFDILWLVKDWPSIWGLLRSSVTFHIVDEVAAMVSTNSNFFIPLLGDDQFIAKARSPHKST